MQFDMLNLPVQLLLVYAYADTHTHTLVISALYIQLFRYMICSVSISCPLCACAIKRPYSGLFLSYLSMPFCFFPWNVSNVA